MKCSQLDLCFEIWKHFQANMVPFTHLVRFECVEDGTAYYADLGPNADGPPIRGTQLGAFKTFQDLTSNNCKQEVTVSRVSY